MERIKKMDAKLETNSLLVESLSHERLKETIELVEKIFPHDIDSSENPAMALPTSLDAEHNGDFLKSQGIRNLNYWLAFEKKDGPVVGFAGLYEYAADPADIGWIGWYGMSPDVRGKGYGRALLESTIAKARERGYSRLRLYTYTDEDEVRAQELYEKMGFKIIEEKPSDVPGEMILTREKILRDESQANL